MSARSLKIKPVERMVQRTFDTITCGEGAAVIDALTGHTITEPMRLRDAHEKADILNVAASFGPRHLASVMSSI